MQSVSDGWYESWYERVSATARPKNIAHKIMHASLELTSRRKTSANIIEIGGNKAEHLPFVRDNWSSYVLTDIREPDSETLLGINNAGAIFQLANVEDLPFPDSSFDRVIVTCVLHHLNNPEQALLEMRRITKQGGQISILLPNDPGLIYRFLRSITTKRYAKKLGVLKELELFHAREHKNHYLSLLVLIKNTFAHEFKIIGFPFLFPNYNLNAFTVIQIEKRR